MPAKKKAHRSQKLTSHKIKPTLREENKLVAEGFQLIAGVDEVGRGCFAGPVVASAVILPNHCRFPWLKEVRDSKFITPEKREYLYERITKVAVAYATGVVGSDIIDQRGIATAARLAMKQAVEKLSPGADSLLIDHFALPEVDLPQWGVANGDTLCCSIACASIVAKVERDRLMCELDRAYPGYNFSQHKGYGTKEHRACIEQLGLCIIHRRTFCLADDGVSAEDEDEE
jgi:ribonuclease HII